MTTIVQAIFGLLLVLLSVGPVGHHLMLGTGGPDLIIVGLWATIWFLDLGAGIRLALICGILLDLLQFSPFGLWTLTFSVLVFALDFFRRRFLSVASLPHALAALLVMSVLSQSLFSLLSRQYDLRYSLIVILSNLILGAIVYYAAATRWKLFVWWSGERL
ncbi:hypothetical protein A3A71_03500 [Candidatus Berkelbacteria bacterium RIFCSPLOWO2_01_FULL_50_28]|uniref:Rod shape-determining protein MreD n=1 Tax=Candidatus Berkelbacteria bacterium RIFCSPLOWO2_01_FULL_50_28 TaxID=1797471 RepID=A0A1F5ECV0_9BACT|nr:MAG: hypothetical protein A2807_03065 [Candidatus Berkelbacteria bacterium RIFCSPHIGHO2_01_FULL_50_36]OGD63644.1 MAG: hypothetical protein A3F39_04280 [Candidatus Berkelbacteria bacterium RIFCSPHIGHO2_12_FULL_50_11]OGD65120.1 MAG: hypothetical protein A3A71_03500 [Candidatus Berkelbacteria bacterium RIFCSPLOWO2_01_FULL_50_28]